MTTIATPSLPILNLEHLNGTAEEYNNFLNTLRHAARDIGFFYLINHGIDNSLQTNLQQEARHFFALSEEEKQKVGMVNSPHFRGYNRAAAELTRGQPDWREQFDIGAERPARVLNADDPLWYRLQGPNLWPENQPSLKSTLLTWQDAMTQMSLRLLQAFAEALSLPKDAFDVLYGDKPNEHIKLIRYPGRHSTQGDQGVGAHKDAGFLSFLLQDTQRGLQVEVSPDEWIDATPIPNSFVVNIGELLELATNGYLRATVHRVVSPPADSDRLSIAFFLGAKLDAVVPIYELPKELTSEAIGPESDPLNPLLRDVGWNYLKGRLRSHPDVAERHYSDALRTESELTL